VDKAILDYTKALQLNPTFAKGYYNRGMAHRLKGAHDKAKTDLKKAAKLGFSQAKESLKHYYKIEVK